MSPDGKMTLKIVKVEVSGAGTDQYSDEDIAAIHDTKHSTDPERCLKLNAGTEIDLFLTEIKLLTHVQILLPDEIQLG